MKTSLKSVAFSNPPVTEVDSSPIPFPSSRYGNVPILFADTPRIAFGDQTFPSEPRYSMYTYPPIPPSTKGLVSTFDELHFAVARVPFTETEREHVPRCGTSTGAPTAISVDVSSDEFEEELEELEELEEESTEEDSEEGRLVLNASCLWRIST